MSSWQNGKVTGRCLSGPVRGLKYSRPKANTCEQTSRSRQSDSFRNSCDKLNRHREQNGEHIRSWGSILCDCANQNEVKRFYGFDPAAYVESRSFHPKLGRKR